MKTIKTDFNDKRIFETILNGEVVIFPTETVYGIGCIYDSEDAFNNLVKAKNRNPDKPFTLMLGDKSQIEKYAIINEKTRKIIDKFMPGEITILVKPVKDLYPWVTLNSEYIGIRVPDYKEVCDLINKLGKPMLVSSANISSFPPCKDYIEVYNQFNGIVPYIIEGKTKSSVPSTIVSLDDDIKLIRQGSILFEDIFKVWEEN